MGWCHEFGCQITSGCNHPMKAGASACSCTICDTVCTGKFSGCPEVFARAVPVAAPSRPAPQAPPATTPAPAAAARQPAVQHQADGMLSRENGARVLHWMRAEFDGVKSQLHAVASGLAHQQAVVADLAANRAGELHNALAELEGSTTALRTEASRMRRDAGGLQEDGAELRRESARLREIEREMNDRLPQVVADAVQPELRAALREVEAITAGLREEASQLRAVRDGLHEQLPRLVEAAVREVLASFTPPAPAAGPAPMTPAQAQVAPQANMFGGQQGADTAPGPAPAEGALADEPADDDASSFGAPPPARPAAATATDEGVGEDPLACTLPGLVVGPSFALSVSEALRRAGLRSRRRRRDNSHSPGLPRGDPFATHITSRVDRYARARADLAAIRPPGQASAGKTPAGKAPGGKSSSGKAANGSGPPPPSPTTLAIGFRDAEEVTLDLAEVGLLSVMGPAASDVARFLTTSFVAQGAGTGEALVVGDLLPPGLAVPGLNQPRDLADCLRQLAEDRSPTAPATVLVVARDPAPDDLEALLQLLDRSAGAEGPRVLAVLVDIAPERAVSFRLEANERAAEISDEALAGRLGGARLYTLGREAASELLAVLASARTDDDASTSPALPLLAAAVGEAEPFEVVLAESPAVDVQLLGTYRIEVDGTEIRAGLRAKARELLAFYLLHPAGTTLDAAVEALWPEADPGRGSEWFWTALGNLRSRLRDATGEKKLKVIERDGDRYRVEPLFDVDLWRLEQALSEGAAGGDDFVRAAAYDRVAQTYAGDLLAGADWAWAETPRDDLRQRVLDVQVWLGDIRWASGDARGSWQALQRAVEVDPYAEQIYRRIMRLQSKLGRPDDATATFRRLQARLEEVELEPTPESEKLHADLASIPQP
ncbi:MAG: BTAD domain-containing putative transcriptional regulator [Acidimicrobiales bacterium]